MLCRPWVPSLWFRDQVQERIPEGSTHQPFLLGRTWHLQWVYYQQFHRAAFPSVSWSYGFTSLKLDAGAGNCVDTLSPPAVPSPPLTGVYCECGKNACNSFFVCELLCRSCITHVGYYRADQGPGLESVSAASGFV